MYGPRCSRCGLLTPLGYLLARFDSGAWVIDTLADIPIVLPPLVLGLSLLILFHMPFGDRNLEAIFRDDFRMPVTYSCELGVGSVHRCMRHLRFARWRITFEQINPRCEDVARARWVARAGRPLCESL